MATKWKSSLLIITCTILFTFGLTGLILLTSHGTFYAHKDYFHTSEFLHGDLDEFARNLGTYELNNISLTEAKEAITITEEEIYEHRYRYGDLPEQTDSITQQYEERIRQALDRDDEEAADAYYAERDAKIEDITLNFESDAYVEAKIIKEKEANVEKYYVQKENGRNTFENESDTFQYYFTDSDSGEAYTNLPEENASLEMISDKNMIFVTDFTITPDYMVNYEATGSDAMMDVLYQSDKTLDGKIGISKSLPASNPLMQEYEDYKWEQILFWSVVAISVIALLVSILILKKAKKSRAEVSRWRSHYNKLPIDVRVLLFGLAWLFTFIAMLILSGNFHLIFVYSVANILPLVILMVALVVGVTLTVIQAVFLFDAFKDWGNLVKEWQESLLYRILKILKRVWKKMMDSLKEAFLDQATGIQVMLVFGAIFVLGLAVFLTVIHPIFIIFYILLLGVVGIPLCMTIIRKVGYFNRIVENTNELAAGNLSQDLKVTGKSVFATLASNINLLRQGVKVSQNEQAKSERLKTELITNVSHDLRTPLTSIITYTELLKKQQDTSEEHAAYLEIIDRKSKRLKVLIDDLFEVSKMASGNIELKKEQVDLVQLLQQALAEYDDLIQESSLQFRVINDAPPVHAVIDGQKFWRVFDNLIGNILKYSLANSRVYINLASKDNEAIITFKNVSKYELNDNSEELFERFKRGDVSRNTEGSGLGLAIAQSIVDLHDGSLDIETDGDLFKVTIRLRLLKKER
ncbi:MFS domain-containing histidine kinase [Oceanobacillus bengalensis]|uniref:histidine kinase n=1 Tax=Oceanobacillus bengalensis TaxID=1435466 RepID=A0A494Z7H8_9BACI|nr:MFS domain-containing histidine kinase [Oceanobacillus bengalensis]RKQ18553.1 sensor histidine kinase [Oceanobacillus bengalensis]